MSVSMEMNRVEDGSNRGASPTPRLSTGVPGLDEVLDGGLPRARHHLVRGGPGTGKTSFSLHFLSEGATADERTLYVSLSSPEADVRADAAASGIDLSNVAVLDLSSPTGLPPDGDLEAHLFREDHERIPLVQAILGSARDLGPWRVVIDSLTRVRELIPDVDEFRREVLSLVRGLNELGATIVSVSEHSPSSPDDELQFLADGVISIDASLQRRTLTVTKLRGSGFRSGSHTVRLSDAGMVVYPRLVPDRDGRTFSGEQLSFGVPEINELLHGGLERGTMTLISGPSGVGKTTVGAQFMKEAAGRGERSVLFMFDEAPATFVHRAESVSIPVREMLDRGTLSLVPVEPLALSPDEIAHLVRTEVEQHGATAVMLDSVASYQLSVADDQDSGLTRLHALGRYLKTKEVTGLLIDEIGSVTGDFVASEHGLSYLADTVIFLRYLEVRGEIGKVIGVLKKRTGSFESTLREFDITSYGLKVGAPLKHLRGVLSGIPEIEESTL